MSRDQLSHQSALRPTFVFTIGDASSRFQKCVKCRGASFDHGGVDDTARHGLDFWARKLPASDELPIREGLDSRYRHKPTYSVHLMLYF
jgi:hypothetical protein